MPPAARLTDPHGQCPGIHVGGPIKGPGAKKTKIAGLSAARKGDKATCGCGALDPIAKGSTTVIIEGKQAARVDDPTAHGGKIVKGEDTVIIGDTAQESALSDANKKAKGACKHCP